MFILKEYILPGIFVIAFVLYVVSAVKFFKHVCKKQKNSDGPAAELSKQYRTFFIVMASVVIAVVIAIVALYLAEFIETMNSPMGVMKSWRQWLL